MRWLELKIPPLIYFAAAIAAMLVVDAALSSLRLDVPLGNILPIGFVVAGVALSIPAIADFTRRQTTIWPHDPTETTALVVSGVYGLSRNPMYLGMVFLLAGWMFRLANPFNIVILVAFIILMTAFQIKPEERALYQKFADEYEAYCKRVRRWI